MAVEENVDFLIKKCMTAVAFTIIKCKPDHLTAKDFCLSIQKRLKASTGTVEDQNDAPHIFSSIVAEPSAEISVSQEAMEIGNHLKTAYYDSDDNKSSCLNLKIIQAMKTVKNAIVAMKGHIVTRVDENLKLQMEHCGSNSNLPNTQDSGYRSTSQSYNFLGNSQRYKVEKQMMNLDSSILILKEFLTKSKNVHSESYILIYTSDILGEITDVLYEKNIILPSLNVIFQASDTFLEKVLDLKNNNHQDMSNLNVFYNLNKSRFVIQRTLEKLNSKLNEISTLISSCGQDDPLEIKDINSTDTLYYLLSTVEHLIGTFIEKENSLSEATLADSSFHNDENADDEMAAFTTAGENWNLSKNVDSETIAPTKNIKMILNRTLNRIVIQCVDSYPLISYWVLDIITKNKLNT